MIQFSIIVPVFNRPDEVKELLESLCLQKDKNFSIVLVEDGSSIPCRDIVNHYHDKLDIKYFFKDNSGPGDSRNYGMEKSTGDYFIFFDSDCVIPPDYFENINDFLSKTPLDTFGGPDDAAASFSNVQKAINYAMTSVITTGGIRGKETKLDNYQPRSFNMGVNRRVYETVGGFSDIHPGEDPDWSYRIMNAGFKIGLISEAKVWHKRRIDFGKFSQQVYKFGVVRIILMKWYPDKFKLTYTLPSLFLLGSIVAIISSALISTIALTPLLLFIIVIFVDALRLTKKPKIALMAVLATLVQLYCYGFGFLKSWWKINVLRQKERLSFKKFFFRQE